MTGGKKSPDRSLFRPGAQHVWDNRGSLWLWPAAILIFSWAADIAAFLAISNDSEAAAGEPLTVLSVVQIALRAASGAIQPWPTISSLWGFLPELTNPFILILLANLLEILVAAVSAWFLAAYLRRAALPLRSRKWFSGAPGTWLIFTLTLLWFRLFGPLRDVFAIITGLMVGGVWALAWQILALVFFAPVMFAVYIVVLGKQPFRAAAAASVTIWRRHWMAAAEILGLAAIAFFLPAIVNRFIAPGSYLGLASELVADALRIGLGFWFATIWLLFVNDRYNPKNSTTL